MLRFSTSIGCVLLASALITRTGVAQNWIVYNDHPDTFKLVVTPKGAAPVTYTFAPEQRRTIKLGTELHGLVSMLANDKYPMDHDEKNLSQYARKGVTPMSQIRTPVGETREGVTIYQSMPDFPANDKYTDLIEDLRRSVWQGTFDERGGQNRGSIRFRGDEGDADYGHRAMPRGTTLDTINYVPGDTFFITAEWQHGQVNGELTLMIDPENPLYLEGYYQRGGQRAAGKATRLSPRPVEVVVAIDTAEIKSAEGVVVATVSQDERLVVHKVDKHWWHVSYPGQQPIGWIQPKHVRIDSR